MTVYVQSKALRAETDYVVELTPAQKNKQFLNGTAYVVCVLITQH